MLNALKLSRLTLSIMLIIPVLLFGQNDFDEFFEPKSTIGGYGELHYNLVKKEGSDATKTLDFHRFIIFYSHSWTEKWSFKSEVEIEHNFVQDGQGELELEQAYVNYHSSMFGFQAGVILPSVGLINEYHEPPLFLSVERPEYSKYVVPTTWFGNGLAVYGSLAGLQLRFALLEDMDGESISKGIRSGRGKGFKTSAYNWTKNLSVNFTGISGLRVSGSYTTNDAPIDNKPDSTVGFGLMETNLKYDANNIHAVLEYGSISYTDNPGGYKTSGGYYMDLGYNIASLIGLDSKLMPWVRYSDYNRGNDDADQHYTIQRFGLTCWPIPNIVFKLEYGTWKKESSDDADTQINVGMGYNF